MLRHPVIAIHQWEDAHQQPEHRSSRSLSPSFSVHVSQSAWYDLRQSLWFPLTFSNVVSLFLTSCLVSPCSLLSLSLCLFLPFSFHCLSMFLLFASHFLCVSFSLSLSLALSLSVGCISFPSLEEWKFLKFYQKRSAFSPNALLSGYRHLQHGLLLCATVLCELYQGIIHKQALLPSRVSQLHSVHDHKCPEAMSSIAATPRVFPVLNSHVVDAFFFLSNCH